MLKQVSFFWAGERMTWLRYMTLYSFSKMNPDWQIRLYLAPKQTNPTWVSKNLQDATHGPNHFNLIWQIPNLEVIPWDLPGKWAEIAPAHKCDIREWQTLAEGGGLFCDMDILFIRPIAELYEQIGQADTVVCYDKIWSIGVMGSNGENQFYKDLFRYTFTCFDKTNYQTAGASTIYNVLFDRRFYKKVTDQQYEEILRIMYPNLHFFNIPQVCFYFWNASRILEIYKDLITPEQIPEGVIGVHWYGGHPMSQTLNDVLTADTVRKMGGILCKLLVKVMEAK